MQVSTVLPCFPLMFISLIYFFYLIILASIFNVSQVVVTGGIFVSVFTVINMNTNHKENYITVMFSCKHKTLLC